MEKGSNRQDSKKELQSNSVLNPEYSLTNTANPFQMNESMQGDSVDEHNVLEETNEALAHKELGQQNENG